MSSARTIDDAVDSTSVVEDYTDNNEVLAVSSDPMTSTESEDTNKISSTSTTTVETTTAITTTSDTTTIITPPIPKPSSSINKLQNVEWRREWRGIHLPPSAGILNSKFYNKNDIIDEIEHIEEVSDEEYVDDVDEVAIEVLPVEAPIVEAEPIEDTPEQQSLLYTQNQPSIPLYPLLLTIILYQLLKYLFRKLFNYKKRTRFMRSMKCRINSLGGNYEQFAISQSELTGHIEKLKSRNEKKKKRMEVDDKQKKKKKGKDGDKSDAGGGKRDDDDTDGDDKGMGDETDENENEGGNSSNTNCGSGSTGTNNKSSGQSDNNKGNSYSSTNHSTNHNEQAIIQEYKVKVQQLTQQNEVLLLKVNQLEVENEQLDNEMEHMMDEMCNIDEKNEDSHDGKEIDISGSYSDTIVESLTDDDDDEEDTLLQELEDAKVNISTLTKERQVAKEKVLHLTMEVAKLTSDKEGLEQRLKDEEGKGHQRSSSYDALLAERDILNDALSTVSKTMQDAHIILSELAGDIIEQDDTGLEEEDAKTTPEMARHSASRLLSQLSRIKENGGLLPPSPPASPPISPTSPTDQASFDRLEIGRKSLKKIEASVVSSTVSSPAAGDLLIDLSSPRRQVDPTSRELFPLQGQAKEIVLLPKILPPPPVVKDCAMAVDSQHTQDSTKASSSSSSSGEDSSAGDVEWHNKPIDNSATDDSMNEQSISYGMNETYCSDDDYDGYDNDLIVGFKDSILNRSKTASRNVDAIQRSRGLSKLVRIWSKRSERSKW